MLGFVDAHLPKPQCLGELQVPLQFVVQQTREGGWSQVGTASPTSKSSSSDSWVARGTSAASSLEFMALLPLREAGPLLFNNQAGKRLK